MEAPFYDSRHRVFTGGRNGLLAMFAGGPGGGPIGAGGPASFSTWPFDCYGDRKRVHVGPPGPGFGAGAFSIDCLLTAGRRRHAVEDGALPLSHAVDNLNLIHIGKLARTADIDGQYYRGRGYRMTEHSKTAQCVYCI